MTALAASMRLRRENSALIEGFLSFVICVSIVCAELLGVSLRRCADAADLRRGRER
jgi:hypothetical protein